ncbi:hypothetical protein QM012_005010 [Aureobasidium pullulans]|uniref:Uncharacterized protein n=1 Tax=Aureobasidium pullulans TaxID=5580 RepID=A0ABR0T6I0_AURPU
MSTDTVSTTTATSGMPQLVQKPSEDEMIVSITRHRHSDTDVTYTYQLPLPLFSEVRYSDETLLAYFKIILRLRLGSNKVGHSTVWRMSDTGQIAFVRSMNSFAAAVLDHKNANKKVIQLFVVKNDNIESLPDLEFSE